MDFTNKLTNAFEKMDLYIKPIPSLFQRIKILLDKKIMKVLYGYNTDDYYLYEFYRLKLSARKNFIGQNNGMRNVVRLLNDANETSKFQNKIIFNKVFAKYLHRDWMSIHDCAFDQFCAFCANHSSFIKKPVDQLGGVSIEKFALSKNTDLSELYDKLKGENCIIEEIVKQDKAVASFNPHTVNTIRVYSILNKSNVLILDAYLRMGVGDVVVDNFHMGGIGAKIDVDTGIIMTPGKNIVSRTFIFHPFTNKQIIGFKIPRWADIKKTIEEAVMVVPAVRYVAWDVVVTDEGDICIIEGNHNGCFNFQESIDLEGKKSKYEYFLQDIVK